MVITDEMAAALLFYGVWILTLALCLIALFWPAMRRRSNPFAWVVWLNLAAGALWFAQFPIAQLQQARFAATDPGYARSAKPFDARSVYIPTPRRMREAAYSCYLSYSSLCEMPVAHMLKTGQLDFVEIGTDPVMRYSLAIHDPRCLDWSDDLRPSHFDTDFILTDEMLSPGLGACVLGQEVANVTATHDITVTRANLRWPAQSSYWSVQLRDRATGTLIDRFDGWFGADPYLNFDPPSEPRRHIGPLADLLMQRADQNRYDPAPDDAILAEYGINEDLILRAIASPYQAYRARTLWMACRNGVLATLSPDTRAALTDASATVFAASPDWRFPRDCPPHTR